MAGNMPLSLQDLQDRINTLVENDNDTPDTDDDEWLTRINLINQSISKWELQDVFWDELYTTYTHGSTVANNTTTYSLSALTNLRFLAGPLTLTLNGVESKVEIISPEESEILSDEGERKAWLTGNNSAGWTLNLGWTPTTGDGTVGATISFPYYKYATRFTSDSLTTDEPEMSDPNFIIYDVAATKSLMESKNNQFSIYNTEAQTCIDTMRTMNEVKPYYNSNAVEDIDAIGYGAVMGE